MILTEEKRPTQGLGTIRAASNSRRKLLTDHGSRKLSEGTALSVVSKWILIGIAITGIIVLIAVAVREWRKRTRRLIQLQTEDGDIPLTSFSKDEVKDSKPSPTINADTFDPEDQVSNYTIPKNDAATTSNANMNSAKCRNEPNQEKISCPDSGASSDGGDDDNVSDNRSAGPSVVQEVAPEIYDGVYYGDDDDDPDLSPRRILQYSDYDQSNDNRDDPMIAGGEETEPVSETSSSFCLEYEGVDYSDDFVPEKATDSYRPEIKQEKKDMTPTLGGFLGRVLDDGLLPVEEDGESQINCSQDEHDKSLPGVRDEQQPQVSAVVAQDGEECVHKDDKSDDHD
mmetsp:Transcript_22838/g.40161  ORF Transcript_22838/g.40161 Transcript_22838/m.40161 type:complete len:341 (-) Transcript_22838:2005-3027(-)